MRTVFNVACIIAVGIGAVVSAFVLTVNDDTVSSLNVLVSIFAIGICRFSQSVMLFSVIVILGIMAIERDASFTKVAARFPLAPLIVVSICFSLKAAIEYWLTNR